MTRRIQTNGAHNTHGEYDDFQWLSVSVSLSLSLDIIDIEFNIFPRDSACVNCGGSVSANQLRSTFLDDGSDLKWIIQIDALLCDPRRIPLRKASPGFFIDDKLLAEDNAVLQQYNNMMIDRIYVAIQREQTRWTWRRYKNMGSRIIAIKCNYKHQFSSWNVWRKKLQDYSFKDALSIACEMRFPIIILQVTVRKKPRCKMFKSI